MQEDIDKLYAWSVAWQMSFNAKKCLVMSISRRRCKPLLEYRLGQILLTPVDSYYYLGVTISSDLRWSTHIDNICTKATRTLNFIGRQIDCCSPESKSLAYTVVVRPHLEFAACA